MEVLIGDAGASCGFIGYTSVYGNNYVGGVIGSLNYGSVTNVYVNANVEAYSYGAGGVVGFLDNSSMTATLNRTNLNYTMLLDAAVTAPSKAGGLIGDIATEIYRDQSFYYNNYVDADVTSENTSTGSLIIGGRPDENSYITNTYVYKFSKLNANYVYATNDNINDKQYLIRTDLNNQSTFSSKIGLGTTYWNYAPLSDGKYPKIKDSYLYKPELQTGVDLPTDPEIAELNALSIGDENDNNVNGTGANTNNLAEENRISTQSIESLPSVSVYPVSVNEINIDFSSIPEQTCFTYYVNGEEKEAIDLEQKTYTFKYNYQDTLKIKLTNGTDEETITINPDDARSEASLIENNNAYLLGTNLYINGELQQGEYVNVCDGYALNSNGQMLDIGTKQLSDGATETTLENRTKPIHTYNYKKNNIEVYGS